MPNTAGPRRRISLNASSAPTGAKSPQYNVILEGHITPGQSLLDVAKRLAKLVGVPPTMATRLLSGHPTTIKNKVELVVAQRCLMSLVHIGAGAHIEPVVENAAPVAKADAAPMLRESTKLSGRFPTETPSPADQPRTESISPTHVAKAEKSNKAANTTSHEDPTQSRVKESPSRREDADAEKATKTTPSETAQTAKPVPQEPLTLQRLHKAINRRVTTLSAPLGEQFRLLTLTALVLLLPIIYVALITGILAAVQWHVYYHFDWLEQGNAVLVAIPYAAPAIVGLVIAFLLAKPLLAPTRNNPDNAAFDEVKDALLFTFVERIAHAINATPPVEIQYTWQTTLFADKKATFLRMFRGKPVLVIGLPLIGALNARQLANLIAYELLKFSKLNAFRIANVIDSIYIFLNQGAYEQDLWDVRLDHALQRNSDFAAIALLATKGLIDVSRYPLILLNRACELLAGPYLNRVKLDADRYASYLAGSEDARSSLTRLSFFDAAQRLAVEDAYHKWQNGEYIDNLPNLIIRKSKELPSHVINEVRQKADQRVSGAAGIYPSLSERITVLSVLPTDGMIDLDVRALELVPRYEEVCLRVTRQFNETLSYYNDTVSVRQPRHGNNSIPSSDNAKTVLARYYQGLFHPDRYIVPQISLQPVAIPPAALEQQIRTAIEQIRANGQTYANTLSQYQLSLTQAPPQDTTSHLQPSNREILERSLQSIEKLFERRLGLALQVATGQADDATKHKVVMYVEALKILANSQPMVNSLLFYAQQLNQPRFRAGGNMTPENQAAARKLQRRCRDIYVRILSCLLKGCFPFQGGDDPTFILAYFQHDAGSPDDMCDSVEQCLASAGAISRNVRIIHRRIMTELAEIAASVEQQLGLVRYRTTDQNRSTTGPTSSWSLGAQV